MNIRKVILNLHVADELIKKGFRVVEVKPSTKLQGRTAFLFNRTPEFETALSSLSNRRKV